jgi:hypothetical protein
MTIEFVNLREVLAGVQKKVDMVKNLQPTARQMAQAATNDIKKNCRVDTGNWKKSWKPFVEKKSDLIYEFGAKSEGAFSNGFDYGALQEALHHPGAIGWEQAQPEIQDIFNKNIRGIVTANQYMSDFANLDTGEW